MGGMIDAKNGECIGGFRCGFFSQWTLGFVKDGWDMELELGRNSLEE